MNREIAELREVVQKLVPLLAGRGLAVTQRGSRAYVATNPVTRIPERVNIPMIGDNASADFIRAIQGFIDHEVAHVLITDWNFYGGGPTPAELKKPEVQQFLQTHNIVEDTMIEREIVKIFPGSSRNIADLRKHFIEKVTKPALATEKDPKKAFSYILVPLMRALAGHTEFQEFMDDAKLWTNPYVQGVVSGLKPETLKLLKTCSTTKETLEISRELHAILFPPKPVEPPKPAAPPIPSPPPPEEPEKDEDGEPDESESEDAGKESKSEDKPDKKAGEGDGDGERDHEDQEDGEDDKSGDAPGEKGESDDEEEDAKPGSGGDEAEEDSDEKDDHDDRPDDAGDARDEEPADVPEEPGETADGEDEGDGGDAPDEDEAEDEAGDGGSDADGEPDDASQDEEEDLKGDDAGDEQGDADEDDGDGAGSAAEDEGDEGDSSGEDGDEEGEGTAGAGGADSEDKESSGDTGLEPLNGVKVGIQTDDNSDGEIKDTPDDDQGGGGGIGNDSHKSIFDFEGDAFKEADLSSQITLLLTDEAVAAMDRGQYTPFTRELDEIKPIEPPEKMNERWVPQMEEETLQMTGRMQKDIERMLASQSHVIRVAGQRRGKLHAPSFYKLLQNDNRVFSQKEEHKSLNTVVTLLVDNSGSMSGDKIRTAMVAAYALSSTLEKVKIPNEIIGFTTGGFRSLSTDLDRQMQEDQLRTGIRYDRVVPIVMPIYKDFDERMSALVKRRIAYVANAQPNLAGNIDGESLEYAAMRIMKRPEKRKVILVLSDGQPAGGMKSGPHLSAVVQDLAKMQIECVGIGIMDSSVKRYYPNHTVLQKLDELPGTVMGELRRILG